MKQPNSIMDLGDECFAIVKSCRKKFIGFREVTETRFYPLRGWSGISWELGDKYFHRCVGSMSECEKQLVRILNNENDRPDLKKGEI